MLTECLSIKDFNVLTFQNFKFINFQPFIILLYKKIILIIKIRYKYTSLVNLCFTLFRNVISFKSLTMYTGVCMKTKKNVCTFNVVLVSG